MQATTGVQQLVDTIIEASRRGTDASLRAGGVAMPPQIHLLVEDWEPPYLGYMTCRPIQHGRDVTPALRGLGLMALLVGASRVVLTWENHSLWSDVARSEAPDEPYAHVAVDVHRDGGLAQCWHSFEPRAAAAGGTGLLRPVVPVWGDPVWQRDGKLPIAFGVLLYVWREPAKWDLPAVWDPPMRTAVLTRLEQEGYRMQWLRRDVGPDAAHR